MVWLQFFLHFAFYVQILSLKVSISVTVAAIMKQKLMVCFVDLWCNKASAQQAFEGNDWKICQIIVLKWLIPIWLIMQQRGKYIFKC